MTDNIEKTRPAFEAAVIERLKESGFLEMEIRVECLKPRVGDGYQDEVINAGWHYWKAGIAATTPQVLYVSDEIQPEDIQELLKQYPETIIVARKEPTASELLNKLAEVSAAVGFGAGEPATEIAGHFVSFLAANPVHIQRFMRDGHEMVIDGTFTYDQGNLTYRAVDGTIRHPDELRAANAEKKTHG